MAGPDESPTAWWDNRVAGLEMEAELMEETPESMAKKLFRKNLLGATLSLIDLATKSTNERVRLQAAQYVIERNLGRLQDADHTDPEAPLDRVCASFIKEIPENLDGI